MQKKPTQRRKPPEGYVTAGEAESILQNKMLYKYKDKGLIRTLESPLHRQRFYLRSDVEAIRGASEALFDRGVVVGMKNNTEFARATPDDMEGVYRVAIELFPHGTTSAEDRKPLVAQCPDGNYVVKEQGEIRAFIHMQPLKQEPLKKFMNGEIIGRDIKADDLDCFEPGKTVDVLIKSMGATKKFGETKHRHYTQRLLLGISNALAELGGRGIVIRKIYATSMTETGIALSLHAGMKTIKRLKAPNRKEQKLPRYAFELDVATSDLPLLQPYKEALATYTKPLD